MRKLTTKEIERLASRKNARRIAVENFLMTLTNDADARTARLNLGLDAGLHGWNHETVQAIEDGIRLAEGNRNAPYTMSFRGETYLITEEGWIKRTDMPFEPSETWRIYGIAARWNSAQPVSWHEIKKMLDAGNTVVGYLFDLDHGTIRKCGGSYQGKIPKATLRR